MEQHLNLVGERFAASTDGKTATHEASPAISSVFRNPFRNPFRSPFRSPFRNPAHGGQVRVAGSCRSREFLAGVLLMAACPLLFITQVASGQGLSSPSAAEARQNYAVAVEHWREFLKELRTVNVRFLSASPSEAMVLRAQWDEMIARGQNEVAPVLRRAALAVFQADPTRDPSLSQLLLNMLADDIERDAYEDAMELGSALIAGGHEAAEIHDHTGIAAFALHQFDLAKPYLEEARDRGVLTDRARAMLMALAETKQQWEEELALREIEANANLPRVQIVTTKGDIVVELFEDQAPETVGNFIQIVESDFYKDLLFHRVIAGFMAQTGCPNGDGSGGPGYRIYCEIDRPDHRNHFRGSLSMAKAEAKNTGGSQFFITFQPTPHLNGLHTVFGRVIEGMDVVDQIQRRDPEDTEIRDPDRILEARVIRKRDHVYVPRKVR